MFLLKSELITQLKYAYAKVHNSQTEFRIMRLPISKVAAKLGNSNFNQCQGGQLPNALFIKRSLCLQTIYTRTRSSDVERAGAHPVPGIIRPKKTSREFKEYMMTKKIRHSIGMVLNMVILQFMFACTSDASELGYLSKNACSKTYGSYGAIDEAGYIIVGGIKQWVTIKGKSCSNPAVLFVHGGPGNPMSLFSESLYKEWEQKFTIVQWDQRGSGKTYQANHAPGEITREVLNKIPLTLNLIVNDGLEVTDFLRKKLSKEKIIITGTSWGSVVAVNMIDERPDLFQFYVGLSQLVSYNSNILNSYQNVLIKVKQNGDQQAESVLESLGSPPWTNPRSFGKLRKIFRNLEALSTDDPIVLQAGKEYQTAQYNAAYTAGEELSFIKFIGLNGDGMAKNIELDKNNLDFNIPVYLIQGDEDLLTSAEITKKYFEKIKAPYKNYVTVTRSGHDPNKKMLLAQLMALQDGLKATTELLNHTKSKK